MSGEWDYIYEVWCISQDQTSFSLFQGYLFISVLVNTNSDLIKLIIQSIKNDLASRNPIHVNLALQCIANIGSKEMAEAFGNEIPKLLVSGYDITY